MASRKPQQSTTSLSQLRIIGGQWRSRKLDFIPLDGLRPTPDRVRETLFNWLRHTIPAATCLDLFAGSGALGIEALSRGAQHCTFIDLAPTSCQYLRDNCKKLDCDKATVIQVDAMNWLAQQDKSAQQYDVIFLDPPFNKNMLAPMCQMIFDQELLKPGGFIYIESERTLAFSPLWTLHREKTAGQVRYALFQN